MTRAAAAVVAALLSTAAAAADEVFDVSAYEKRAFEWHGYLELRPERQWLRTDSIGYGLQYPGETRNTADRLGAVAELSGIVRHERVSFNFTGHATWLDEPRGTSSDARWFEAFGAWQANDYAALELGKRALRWGKGYAWSPVAFFERQKDPVDPELAREGFVMATGGLVRSFEGGLRTVAFTPVILPVTGSLNSDYGPTGHANWGGKLYLLWHDTDIDFVYGSQGSRGARWGADFSRNLSSNLEIHGEWARYTDAPQAILTPTGKLANKVRSYTSYLLGARYLTERETTIIAEYYRNGAGYTEAEQAQFFSFAESNLASLVPAARALAAQAANAGYTRPNSMRDYAYLRISQKEPWDIQYFTPALTTIVNIRDGSYTVIPELLYTAVTNLELRLRLAFTRGDSSTEYGEKAVASRIELRVRLYF